MDRPILPLRVVEAQALNPLIRSLRLRADDGAALPGFDAGAHVRVQVTLADGQAGWRHYSLVDPEGGSAAPHEYRIAVRLEADGRGGSRFVHALRPGDLLSVEAPKNDFPLQSGGSVVLVAGGIGVTPLLTMAARRRRDGMPVRMVYAGRSRELLAFLPELQGLLGDALAVHADDAAGAPLDAGPLLDGCGAADTLYVCGPKPLLDAVHAQASARGWARERIHFELFAEPAPEAADHAFELVLAASGRSLTVPADRSILDCLIEAGCDPMFDCRRGECGVCGVPVMEGEIDHRDVVLSARERAAGNVIQPCVSRARGARLVLDI